MRLKILETRRYLRQFRQLSHTDKALVRYTVNMLASGISMPSKYKEHQLKGSMKQFKECHIKGDLLPVYYIDDGKLVLTLVSVGSHSEVFG